MIFSNKNKCPNCENRIEKSLKLKLLRSSEIQCPYCTKALCINESKAFVFSLPFLIIFALLLNEYTDLSRGLAIVCIIAFVVLSYYPARSMEILSTQLRVSED